MSRRSRIAIGVILAVLLCPLYVPLLFVPLQGAFLLAVGWVAFLAGAPVARDLRAGDVAAGIACLVGFAALARRAGGWWARDARDRGGVPAGPSPGVMPLAAGVLLLVGGGVAVAVGLGLVGAMLTGEDNLLMGVHRPGHHRRVQSASNLRQVGLGLLQYANLQGQFPPGATFDAGGTPLHGWPTLILPYVDNVELAGRIRQDQPWDSPANRPATAEEVWMYKNPGTSDLAPEAIRAPMGYATNAWVIGGDRSRRPDSIADGLGQTILAGEAMGDFKPWGSPVHWRDPELGINRVANGFGGPFLPGGANFLFADGSVRFLRNRTPMPIFRALATPDGGEPAVDLDRLDP